MYGTGQLPKFEKDQFELKLDDESDRKFLIPTAEVILTNMFKDKILNKKDLPIRVVASTNGHEVVFSIIDLSITSNRFIKFTLKNIDIFNPYCVEIFTT